MTPLEKYLKEHNTTPFDCDIKQDWDREWYTELMEVTTQQIAFIRRREKELTPLLEQAQDRAKAGKEHYQGLLLEYITASQLEVSAALAALIGVKADMELYADAIKAIEEEYHRLMMRTHTCRQYLAAISAEQRRLDEEAQRLAEADAEKQREYMKRRKPHMPERWDEWERQQQKQKNEAILLEQQTRKAQIEQDQQAEKQRQEAATSWLASILKSS